MSQWGSSKDDDADLARLTIFEPNFFLPHPSQRSLPLAVPQSQTAIRLHFWGVRGDVPFPGQGAYGCHTSCVTADVGQQRLIFDAGTGLCALGLTMGSDPKGLERSGHLFLSHGQWSRTQGLPLFQPVFLSEYCLHIYGPVAVTGASVKHQLMEQLRLPHSAISFREMQAELSFQDVDPRAAVDLPNGVQIRTCLVDPKYGSLGYCLSWKGLRVVYVAAIAPNRLNNAQHIQLLEFVADADLLIYGEADVSQHLRCKSGPAPGDGCPAKGLGMDFLVQLVKQAKVKQLRMVRHQPFYSDRQLATLEHELNLQCPQAKLAREGMELWLLPPGVSSEASLSPWRSPEEDPRTDGGEGKNNALRNG